MKRLIFVQFINICLPIFVLIYSSLAWAEFHSLLTGEKVELQEKRVYNNYKLWNCEGEEDNAPQLVQSQTYLNDIINFITDANPDVFKLEYARDQLCLFVTKRDKGSQLRTVMSAGNTGNGAIKFSNFSDEFNNDAEVAAVIAHELAHITLQHYLGTPSLPFGVSDAEIIDLQQEYFSKFAKFTKKYLSILKELNKKEDLPSSLRQSIQEHIDVFSNLNLWANTQTGTIAAGYHKFDWNRPSQSMDTELFLNQLNSMGYADYALRIQQIDEKAMNIALTKYQSRLKQLMGETESNFWMEIEADLVGLRYYLRAGFDPKPLIDLWLRRAKLGTQLTGKKCSFELNKAPDILYPLKIRNQLPLGQTHPTHCWRAWRLTKEIEFLKKEGWPLGNTVNLYENGDRLKRVKEEENMP